MGSRIESNYPRAGSDKPIMGKGAEISYSPASFVARALYSFSLRYPQISQKYLVTTGMVIEGIEASSKDGMSIWSWEE